MSTPDPITQAAVEAFMTECRKHPVESHWPAGMQQLAGWDVYKAVQSVIDTARPAIEADVLRRAAEALRHKSERPDIDAGIRLQAWANNLEQLRGMDADRE